MLELAGIIILGIFAQWVAWRVKVPAILPLIIIGLVVGPLWSMWSETGEKLIAPMYEEETGRGLFPGQSLFYFVSLAIGIILFEGGLTLKRKELQGVAPAIGKLLTIGTLITFIGAGLGAHFIMDFNWSVAFLFAALIIVTGPTVIAPILQNVPLNRNVSTVLKWEGILIDPIGALAAVLMYEFIISGEGGLEFSSHAVLQFLQIILIGLALGALAAYLLQYLIKRDLVPHFLLNVFTLALVLGVFVLSEELAHESGLLTVVVMGMFLGNLDVPRINDILYFKESLSVLLISILFILLAANIDVEDLMLLMDWRCLYLFLFVILILRPLGVFLSTNGSELNIREKIFISWVGPRGIVAAGIASLFGIRLIGVLPDAEYITPMVFMIVLGTVLLNATTAKPIAKLLGVIQDSSNGILIVGVNTASKVIGKYLMDNDRHVVLIDSNANNVDAAKEEGFEAISANVFNDTLTDRLELVDVGYLMAMTSNSEVNNYAIRKLNHVFGEKGAFRLITPAEMKLDRAALPEEGLFSYADDYLNISEVARDFPNIHEQEVEDKDQLQKLIGQMSNIVRSVPLFIKYPDGFIDVIPLNLKELELPEGCKLVYLGKKLDDKVLEVV
ncbi:MAG: sodium:proton antiporter [Bacteroidetes bacterium]|nr:sodium:proton antiporter [Bacteroidota bacterium]